MLYTRLPVHSQAEDCLEPHDCVLGKLVRFDEKDQNFAEALVVAGLVDLDTLAERVTTLPAEPPFIDRISTWIFAMRLRHSQPIDQSPA